MRKSIPCGLLICLLISFTQSSADPQAVLVGRQKVTPDIALTSLTISASPAMVNFRLASKGVAAGSSSIAVTTTWGAQVCVTICTINVYAYFASAGAALAGGSPIVNIPSSAVLGEVPTGSATSFTPFTQSGSLGGAGAGLLLLTQSFLLTTVLASSRTDALNLEINLANQPQLPAGAYSGTLYIQAQTL